MSTDHEILTTATHPDFRAWLARIKHIGGCQHPIHLIGHTLTLEAGTGRLLAALTSETQPHKLLARWAVMPPEENPLDRRSGSRARADYRHRDGSVHPRHRPQ